MLRKPQARQLAAGRHYPVPYDRPPLDPPPGSLGPLFAAAAVDAHARNAILDQKLFFLKK
jgi:hypothetical protein